MFRLRSGWSDLETVMPVHSLVHNIKTDVVDILPPVHALTGCDTTSEVGAKTAALKTANEYDYELFVFLVRQN